MNTKEALEKIKEIHGNKYKVADLWEYKNAKSDITLYCPEHGEFHKDFYRLVNMKQGCPVCSHRGIVYKHNSFWNNKENCIEEAKKYRNKFELQRKNYGCYKGAVRNGWIDEIANMCYDNSIHYMGYDEPVNCVYVYEYNDLNTFYVGRTNNIKRRHRQHCNGYGHKDGTRDYDVVYTFAKENNIEIPVPIILEENLTAEQSQDREDYWKNLYIEKGMTCLNKATTGIGKGSLGANIKWDYNSCKLESSKYSSRQEMRNNNQSVYNACLKNGWLTEFFNDWAKRKDNYWNNLENVLNAAKECTGARDMAKKFGGAYNAARKNGWTKLLVYKK
jgi:predicted GIY-YIG superfamily endonuclease